MDLGRAITIASTQFQGVLDKGGRPYILHCLWVMNKVRHLGDDYMIAAVLHDLIEDTDWTSEMLVKEGFDAKIIVAISYLTHEKGESYRKYIQLLSKNDIAKQVKLRDLEHNSKITRLKGVSKKDTERMVKYNEAYIYLQTN